MAGHTHPHTHPASGTTTEPTPGPSREGSVVLDIGGDRGALVVYTPPDLADAELEIRPRGRGWDGTHTGVRRRDLRDGSCFAGVFATLAAGEYELRVKGSETVPVLTASVVGGTMTEAQWPALVGARPGA